MYLNQFPKVIAVLLLLVSSSLFSQTKTSRTLLIDEVSTQVDVLSDTPIGFYKTVETNKYYIENKKNNSGLVYLENLSYPLTNGKNRGKLLVVFNDCVSVRTKTSKSDISEGIILQLIEEYENCGDYSKEFELSERQKKDQSFANQKSIVNYDFGVGYYSQELEFTVNNNSPITTTEGSLSAYASVNISPKHLGNLTGRLFYDFTLQYNFKAEYNFAPYQAEISSAQITVAPKYYFAKTDAKINPFLGASIGAIVIEYDYTDTSAILFQNIDSSATRLIYGFEVGAQIFTDFEFILSYNPDYKFDIFIDDMDIINSRFQSLNFSLGYKF